MYYQGSLYIRDVATLKKYGSKFKLVLHKSLRQQGFEMDKSKIPKTVVNDTKLSNNISRAKSRVFEYAICNDFEYFVTLTIDNTKYDRGDLNTYYKAFRTFLKNYSRNHKTKIQYVFIPEKHKDGNWHMHGLIKGIPKEHLSINKYGYLDWNYYKERFGFISLSKIKNNEACCKYITKYINKDLQETIKELNQHMYYCSKGLKKATEIKRGTLSANSIPYDFENDYVKIKWLDDESLAKSLIDSNSIS